MGFELPPTARALELHCSIPRITACGLSVRKARLNPATMQRMFVLQVTKSSYTLDEDFSVADKITDELGEDAEAGSSVTLATLAEIVKERTAVAAS